MTPYYQDDAVTIWHESTPKTVVNACSCSTLHTAAPPMVGHQRGLTKSPTKLQGGGCMAIPTVSVSPDRASALGALTPSDFDQGMVDSLTAPEWACVRRHVRHKLRNRGWSVPILPTGPRKGYVQPAEHVAARVRCGSAHHAWMGDAASVKAGRSRAIRKFKGAPSTCTECGRDGVRIDRHHIDGNTKNNDASNIAFLCRRCHMAGDGRLAAFIELGKENQPYAVASRWR